MKSSATTAGRRCPRCYHKLTDPEGLGWCPGCGYCRSVELEADEAASARRPARRQPSPLGIVEFFEMLRTMPRWLRVLLGGIAIVAVISLAANFMLPEDSLARALWSTIQVSVGLLGLFAAQVWVFLLIAHESDHLSPKDLIFSVRLWSMTWRRLPETNRQVWLGGWSVSAVLCAAFLVGGLSYWCQFYNPKRFAAKNWLTAGGPAKRKVKNKGSVEDVVRSQDFTKCVIIGYMTDNDKQLRRALPVSTVGLLASPLSRGPLLAACALSAGRTKEGVTSLVLATLIDGEFYFVGVVERGIDARTSDELLKRLAPLVQREPLISGLNVSAIWVKPQVFCEVQQSGFDDEGLLKEPYFKDLLDQQTIVR